MNHPFIEKNKIYTTLAKLSSTKMIDDEFKDNAFSLDYYSGVIPQKSTFLIKVTY